MKKVFSWVWDNILFLETIFLLAFIPLYPKLPLLDIKNTWVYVRVEDFIVFFVLISWFLLLVKGKISLKTPLTLPILFFWIVGALATIHGVVLIFPGLANVFPNVAFLSFLRHVEYISMFFIAYAGLKDKTMLKYILLVLGVTFLGVVFYGFGQKYLGLPAFLTMNEEFAKGVPIQLSALSRVPSTFAGHYDLAAYLVLVIPIFASLVFGVRNWLGKIGLSIMVLLGFALLFMTVSRVSFFVLILVLFLVVFLQKKKFILLSIPVVGILAIMFFVFQPSLLQRFSNTVKEVNVLVDAKTGAAVGHVNFVPSSYFDDKVILQKRVKDADELQEAMVGRGEIESSTSALFPRKLLPEQVPLVVATNVSTGENLPQGTGYINLALSPVEKRLGNFFYELPPDIKIATATTSSQVLVLHGNFLVKRASAYDLSFTTRFQGEWPNAIEAFKRNIFLGSGYGSVSLAVDNNYLRILGEVGVLGLVSFFGIFLVVALYARRVWDNIDSPVARSFVIGFAAGVVGLMLNATLIDVFEASKVAFLLWLLTGVVVGILNDYRVGTIDIFKLVKKAAVSPYAIALYLVVVAFVIYTPMIGNYFIGDDFTWFRWAADCGTTCHSSVGTILNYFTQSDGFFYRPGTKSYFYGMYSIFWLNQVVYHLVSIAIHATVAVLFYLLARKILKSNILGAFAAMIFLLMSGYAEIVFWISATGHLFNAAFALLSLLMFMLWIEKKKLSYYILSLGFITLSLLFHELGVVVPLLLILYSALYDDNFKWSKLYRSVYYPLLFLPVVGYLLIRFTSGSHWTGGDYSYNLIKLPFNIVGNLFGYTIITIVGPIVLPFYEILRNLLKTNFLVAGIICVVFAAILYFLYKKVFLSLVKADRRIIIFCLGFFIISLLPFLGFGNITSRYSYLASLGIIMLIIFMLEKLYQALLKNGRDIALASITAVVAIFVLFHIIQVQGLHGDWRTAGGKVQNFFVSIDELYDDYWSKEPVSFRFVNVPIKTGDAWVFPVGLPDALWFTFQNDNLKVYIDQNLESAISQIDNIRTTRVFEFREDGSIIEVVKDKNGDVRYQERD